jgi:hypothetical protein
MCLNLLVFEQAVSAQRPVRPSVTTTRPSLRLTPRTAMPKFGLGASGGMARGGSAGKHSAGTCGLSGVSTGVFL